MRFRRLSWTGLLALVAGTLALGACVHDAPPVIKRPAPEGRLAVMGPDRNFSLDAPPRDWVVLGRRDNPRSNLSAVTLAGVPAIELKSGEAPIMAVRQVDAMMLATPFLSWSWNLSDHGEGLHPMRIVVGFLGGARTDGEPGDVMGGGLPAHDRALALVWGDSMLERGTLTLPGPEQVNAAPLYTVRGGRENTRKWWVESVDLSRFYQQAWPHDDFRNTRITFIGIASAPRTPSVRGRVSGILLTH